MEGDSRWCETKLELYNGLRKIEEVAPSCVQPTINEHLLSLTSKFTLNLRHVCISSSHQQVYTKHS